MKIMMGKLAVKRVLRNLPNQFVVFNTFSNNTHFATKYPFAKQFYASGPASSGGILRKPLQFSMYPSARFYTNASFNNGTSTSSDTQSNANSNTNSGNNSNAGQSKSDSEHQSYRGFYTHYQNVRNHIRQQLTPLKVLSTLASFGGGMVVGYAKKDLIEPVLHDVFYITPKNKGNFVHIPEFNDPFYIKRKAFEVFQEQFLDKKGREITKILITGSEGSGKTELALKYAAQYNSKIKEESAKKLRTIVILHAQNKEQLEKEYRQFAKALSLSPENKPFEKVKKQVDKQLSLRENWLLIFDNVENYTDVQKYFPSDENVAPLRKQKGQILCTSRKKDFPKHAKFNLFDLDDPKLRFSRQESMRLITTIVGGRTIDVFNDLQIKANLARMLSYSPLAIKRAMIVIRETTNGKDSKKAFLQYIVDFNKTAKAEGVVQNNDTSDLLLDAQVVNRICNKILIQKLNPLAQSILKFCIFLNINQIQYQFLNLRFPKSKAFDEALGDLERFLVFDEVHAGIYRIHPSLRAAVLDLHMDSKTLQEHRKILFNDVLGFFSEHFNPMNFNRNKRNPALFYEHVDALMQVFSQLEGDLATSPKYSEVIRKVTSLLDSQANFCLTYAVSDAIPAQEALCKAKDLLEKTFGNVSIMDAASEHEQKAMCAQIKAVDLELCFNYSRILYSLGRIYFYAKNNEILPKELARKYISAAIVLVDYYNQQISGNPSFQTIIYRTNAKLFFMLEETSEVILQDAAKQYKDIMNNSHPHTDLDGATVVVADKVNKVGINNRMESNNQIAKAYQNLCSILENRSFRYVSRFWSAKPHDRLNQYFEMALVHSVGGQYVENGVLENYEGALPLARSQPDEHSRYPIYLNTLAKTLLLKPKQNDWDKLKLALANDLSPSPPFHDNQSIAKRLFEVSIEKSRISEQYYAEADAHYGLAEIYKSQGLTKEALEQLDKCIDVQKTKLRRSDGHPDLKMALVERDALAQKLQDCQELPYRSILGY